MRNEENIEKLEALPYTSRYEKVVKTKNDQLDELYNFFNETFFSIKISWLMGKNLIFWVSFAPKIAVNFLAGKNIFSSNFFENTPIVLPTSWAIV